MKYVATLIVDDDIDPDIQATAVFTWKTIVDVDDGHTGVRGKIISVRVQAVGGA